MGELPDLTIVIVKDLVFSVVLDHVLVDQLVIDDCWPDCLLILLDLLLCLKLILDVALHRHPSFSFHLIDSNFYY